jgi:hypothetical protein
MTNVEGKNVGYFDWESVILPGMSKRLGSTVAPSRTFCVPSMITRSP